MDKEQAEVIQLLADVLMKFILASVVAALVGVFAIVLIFNPSWPLAIVEIFFGGTVIFVYKHYFPPSKEFPTGGPDSAT